MSFCEIRCPELFQRYVSRHEQTRTFIEPSDVGGSLRNAMSEARLEERRRSRIEDMNSQRLERFRKSVDGRVKRIERMKGKEEKRRAERSMEAESHVLEQSCITDSGRLYERDMLGVKERQRQQRGRGYREPDVSLHTVEMDECSSNEARKELLSRRKDAIQKIHELPGGLWKEHVTSPSSPKTHPVNDVDVIDICGDDDDDDETVLSHDDVTNEQSFDHSRIDIPDGHNEGGAMEDCQGRKRVRFSEEMDVVEEEMVDKCGGSERSDECDYLERVRMNALCPGEQKELEKRQACSQLVTFRHLFMRMERELVQQRRKQQQHKQHVQKIKRAKEDSRHVVECQLSGLPTPRDTLTGQLASLVKSHERSEDKKVGHVLEKRKHCVEKMRDNSRFIEALRAQLQERLKNQRVTLPPLCGCGPSFWDCHPLTCANNCAFYRNPQAYTRAVTSLLASLDL